MDALNEMKHMSRRLPPGAGDVWPARRVCEFQLDDPRRPAIVVQAI
jgi:hypothetical protein